MVILKVALTIFHSLLACVGCGIVFPRIVRIELLSFVALFGIFLVDFVDTIQSKRLVEIIHSPFYTVMHEPSP